LFAALAGSSADAAAGSGTLLGLHRRHRAWHRLTPPGCSCLLRRRLILRPASFGRPTRKGSRQEPLRDASPPRPRRHPDRRQGNFCVGSRVLLSLAILGCVELSTKAATDNTTRRAPVLGPAPFTCRFLEETSRGGHPATLLQLRYYTTSGLFETCTHHCLVDTPDCCMLDPGTNWCAVPCMPPPESLLRTPFLTGLIPTDLLET
jgi:hypothetical protein